MKPHSASYSPFSRSPGVTLPDSHATASQTPQNEKSPRAGRGGDRWILRFSPTPTGLGQPRAGARRSGGV